jgi:hypothetical protein
MNLQPGLGPAAPRPAPRAAITSAVLRTLPIRGKTRVMACWCSSAEVAAVASSTKTCS